MKAVVIYPTGQVLIENFTEPAHRSLAAKVGGLFEIVYHPARLKQPYCMIVNEEFLLRNLPTNPVGCYLYATDMHGHPICGNVIISKVFGADLVSFTEAEAREIQKTMSNLQELLKEVESDE